jgi:hypothetical protein
MAISRTSPSSDVRKMPAKSNLLLVKTGENPILDNCWNPIWSAY